MEESGYTDSLMYLSEKNKVGVVKVDSTSPLKDAYIVALQGMPQTLKNPFRCKCLSKKKSN